MDPITGHHSREIYSHLTPFVIALFVFLTSLALFCVLGWVGLYFEYIFLCSLRFFLSTSVFYDMWYYHCQMLLKCGKKLSFIPSVNIFHYDGLKKPKKEEWSHFEHSVKNHFSNFNGPIVSWVEVQKGSLIYSIFCHNFFVAFFEFLKLFHFKKISHNLVLIFFFEFAK